MIFWKKLRLFKINMKTSFIVIILKNDNIKKLYEKFKNESVMGLHKL
jgi:hypothetical protein